MKPGTVLSALSLLTLIIACNKDKFQTTPFIEIKDYNTKTVHRGTGNELKITIKYFDKEGDMSQAQFFAVRQRLNVRPLPPVNDKADTIRYMLPVFPTHNNGEILFELGYDFFLKESPIENDTIVLRIAVEDRGGHKSDTIQTSKLVIVK